MKIINTIRNKAQSLSIKAHPMLTSNRGDLSTNTIGGIIVGVVVIGLLITAINAFFPGFFGDMFDSMSDKLNANW
jgi:hypothetical protein